MQGFLDGEPRLGHPETTCERVDHRLVGAREQILQRQLDRSGRLSLARENPGGRDPLPLRRAQRLAGRDQKLSRVRGAQRTATCSGNRPLARSLSIGWYASTMRIVPEAERRTIDCVYAYTSS